MWSFIGMLFNIIQNVSKIVAFRTIVSKKMLKFLNAIKSHPAGIDGQNHIIAVPPLKFLPRKEFELRHKSIDPNRTSSYLKKLDDIQDRILLSVRQSTKTGW